MLICCSDRTNPARQSYRRGEEAFAAVCADVGITEYRVLDKYFSEFYRLRTRGLGDGPLLKEWWADAQAAVREMMVGCDWIVSHNAALEYGNLDHGLVRRMVYEMNDRPETRSTTALVQTSTWPVGVLRWSAPCGTEVVKTDPEEFARLKQHYVSRDCWTWSSEEPLEVGIIRE